MITAKEIKTFSEKLGVPARTIDKDWVLGHLLAGIFNNLYFQENLIFKGGTCLKKCYFENYRFSEDLDFTSIHIEKKKIIATLKKVTQKIDSETGILFGRIKIEDRNFEDNLAAYECSIPFWGADHPKNRNPPSEGRWVSSIKMDFTIHEVICLKKEKKKIIHPYSDFFSSHFIPCYSIEEIISEKFRALLQRNYTAPRDYYDLWYIMKNIDSIKWGEVATAFKKKCEYKNITYNSPKDFFDKNKTISTKREWANSLNHHLKTVPGFDDVIADIKDQIAKKKIFMEH
jgi:predicted nucleotidyltransferase component of viral defense system